MEWKNFDLLESYKKLEAMKETVNVKELMSGENGAKRVKEYQIPMASGMTYCYAAKQVDDKLLEVLQELADEAELADKYKALYNGAVINTGEKRLVLHQLTRGQLGDDVVADGINKSVNYNFFIPSYCLKLAHIKKRLYHFAESVILFRNHLYRL